MVGSLEELSDGKNIPIEGTWQLFKAKIDRVDNMANSFFFIKALPFLIIENIHYKYSNVNYLDIILISFDSPWQVILTFASPFLAVLLI